MICQNCGANVNDNEMFCPNCGAQKPATNFEGKEVKSTGVLIASILEMISIILGAGAGFITGLIALILILVKLNPAIKSGNLSEAKEIKKTIKIILWIGLVLIILLFILIAIPNLGALQSALQKEEIKTDILNAMEIGSATRSWYLTAKYDGFEYENVEKGFVKIDEVDGLENYIDPSSYKVSSYLNNTGDGMYYVTIIGEDINRPKPVVAIGPKDLNSPSPEDKSLEKTFYGDTEKATSETYNGTGSGIVYVAPY